AEIKDHHALADTELLHQLIAAFAHGCGDAGEVAFLPKSLVRIHLRPPSNRQMSGRANSRKRPWSARKNPEPIAAMRRERIIVHNAPRIISLTAKSACSPRHVSDGYRLLAAPWLLGFHSRIGRVIERLEMDARLNHVLRHDELIVAAEHIGVIDAGAVAHIAKADRLADRIAVAAAGEIADLPSIAQDGLAPEKNDGRI